MQRHYSIAGSATKQNSTRQHKASRSVMMPTCMDMGFFRGPSNLEEAVHHGANPSSETINKSIEGNVCCLSIIDAAMSVPWTFPLKSKHPPAALIEKFLSRHGTKHLNQKISTNPNGLLAESQMFKHMCQRNGFDFEAKENKLAPTTKIMANLPPQRRTIRTEGGKEFAESDAFRAICNKHDYDVQVTGPELLSQNGKGE
jgi:hypothetical protein